MLHPNIFHLAQLIQLAGVPILERFRHTLTHSLKEDDTPVTEVDIAVHKKLMQWVESQPYIEYIGEEGDAFTGNAPYVLYVDPLDGTNAYLRGIASATVTATIMERQSEDWWTPIIGIIHDPINQWTWGATVEDEGFVQHGPNMRYHSLLQVTKKITPWRVSAIAWRHAPHNMERVNEAIGAEPDMEHQSFGATALGGGLIASGLINAVLFGGESAVETTAMSLIVRCAGGVATDLSGTPLCAYQLIKKGDKYDFLLPNGSIMASSQELTDRLVAVVQKVR